MKRKTNEPKLGRESALLVGFTFFCLTVIGHTLSFNGGIFDSPPSDALFLMGWLFYGGVLCSVVYVLGAILGYIFGFIFQRLSLRFFPEPEGQKRQYRLAALGWALAFSFILTSIYAILDINLYQYLQAVLFNLLLWGNIGQILASQYIRSKIIVPVLNDAGE